MLVQSLQGLSRTRCTKISRPRSLRTLQSKKRPSGHQSVALLLSQTFILPTPAWRVCRTPCIHAGVAESWHGGSRLLPNCAFQSCCAAGGYNRAACGLWTLHRWNPTRQGLIDLLKQRSTQLCICRLKKGHQRRREEASGVCEAPVFGL